MKLLKQIKVNFLQIIAVFILVICNSAGMAQSWTCGDILVDERDGQAYKTVNIGEQCWMAENLNYGTFIRSDTSGSLTHDDGIVEKYCWKNVPDSCKSS